MNKERRKPVKERMIHVGLVKVRHKRLKVHAAQTSTTTQQLVEGLIRQKYIKSQAKNVKL